MVSTGRRGRSQRAPAAAASIKAADHRTSKASPVTAPTQPGLPSAQPGVASAPPPAGSCPSCLWQALPPAPGWRLEPGDPDARPQITTPDDALALVGPMLRGLDREMCVLAALDTKHRLLALETVSVGTCDHTFMGPREVFRDALLVGASAVVVAHNHPSAEATPSADDRQITRRLAQAGSLLGVELLDHLVVGDPDWASLARLGVL